MHGQELSYHWLLPKWAGLRQNLAGPEELLYWLDSAGRGGAISKLGCAFAPARGRGRRFRLVVAAAGEGIAATAASGAVGSPAGGGRLGGVSNRARPPGFLPLTSALFPPSFSRERGPTRSPRANKRRGGGVGPSRTGRRGEGVPAWSGPSSASLRVSRRASPEAGLCRGVWRGGVWKRGGGSRQLRGAPLGGGAAASPPRRPRGATPRGLRRGKPLFRRR